MDLDRIFKPASYIGSLRVVCVGAHPDDPETGCGGTLSRLAAAGHEVTVVYLTRGEAGVKYIPKETITWNPCEEKAAVAGVRTAEALRACSVLGVQVVFTDQPDGQTAAGGQEFDRFTELTGSLKPDLVLTHWPIDTHCDHRIASLLAYQAWQFFGRKFVLAYYEVMTGVQTQGFQPNWYVDITGTWPVKRNACFAHRSQKPDRFYRYHRKLERQRGLEAGFVRAEAFNVLEK